jgi:carbohydrate-selective porin OprB
VKTIFAALLLFLINYSLMYAKDSIQASFGIEYTTEVQTNFDKKYNWTNLLLLSAELPTERIDKRWKNGRFQLETISTYKLVDERIAPDLQTFSNIEEDNLFLNVFLAGYTHTFKNGFAFLGIRNVNQDYFASEYTSLFTNSSNGIHPTLAENFPVANYPLTAVCLHGEIDLSKKIALKSSFYNGTAGKLTGKSACFSVHPRRDGFFMLTEICYRSTAKKYRYYNVGVAYHSPQSSCVVWGGMEQCIWRSGEKSVGLLLQSSVSASNKSDCRRFHSAGILYTKANAQKNETLGLVFNRAIFQGISESAVEVTWRYEVNSFITFQPAFSYIVTGNRHYPVGLFRTYFVF